MRISDWSSDVCSSDLLGDIVFVDIDTVGNEVDKDGLFGSVEAVKTVSDLFMPVKATVLSINDQLDASPELVNTDPYGEGWMIRVKLDNPADVESLLRSEERSVGKECVRKFRSR